MSFSLYLMASHPEIQEKCQEELRDIFGEDAERAATSGDLASMKYLEMCLKESLRLYQSVPIITRTIGEDVVIEGKLIPTGTNVIMAPCLLHGIPAFILIQTPSSQRDFCRKIVPRDIRTPISPSQQVRATVLDKSRYLFQKKPH